MTAQEILDAARQMSRPDQNWLIQMLLLPKGSMTYSEIDEAWAVKLERRTAEAKLEGQSNEPPIPDQSVIESPTSDTTQPPSS